ncbi:hypothetical protein [Actinophytocola sp. KF-1]
MPWSVMSVWWAVIAVVGSGLIGLARKWMTSRFLQRIHDRGGREDLTAAAEALQRIRARRAIDPGER